MGNRKPTFVDLFCGAGGLSLGFQKAGFKHLLGIDILPKMCDTYSKNIGKCKVADVKKLRRRDILKEIGGQKVDIVVGGPPCQGFTPMNFKNWNRGILNDPRNSLIFDFSRLVRELEPKAFLMENSALLSSKRFANYLDQFKKNFAGNYDVKCDVVNAFDHGISQMRRRTICIGQKKMQENHD